MRTAIAIMLLFCLCMWSLAMDSKAKRYGWCDSIHFIVRADTPVLPVKTIGAIERQVPLTTIKKWDARQVRQAEKTLALAIGMHNTP